MEITLITVVAIQAVLIAKFIYDDMVQSYKIGYYERKLKNRDVDISHVENITLSEILK